LGEGTGVREALPLYVMTSAFCEAIPKVACHRKQEIASSARNASCSETSGG